MRSTRSPPRSTPATTRTCSPSDLPLAVDAALRRGHRRGASPQPDVETERGVILEEIAMHDDEPVRRRSHDLFAETLFGDTPLGPVGARHRRDDRDADPGRVDGCYRRRYAGALDRGHGRRPRSTTQQVVDLVTRGLRRPARPGRAARRRCGRAPARPDAPGPAGRADPPAAPSRPTCCSAAPGMGRLRRAPVRRSACSTTRSAAG